MSYVRPRVTQITVANVSPLPGSHINKQRVGRGGKRGGSSGRGNGGQKHHAKAPPPWFSSLYTNPIIDALPRWSWAPRASKPRYRTLNLDRIQFWIETGRLNVSPGQPITMQHLKNSGIIIGRIQDGVKLLGNGATYFKASGLDIQVTKASKSAIAAVESLGGSVTAVYHTRAGIKQHLDNERQLEYFYEPPVLEADVAYYSDPANRGYLADKQSFDAIFRPRGYLYSVDEFKNLKSPDHIAKVNVRYEVENMPAVLQDLKTKRAWRQMWYETEQERKQQYSVIAKQDWKDQKWFENQDPAWKWVVVDQDGIKFNKLKADG